MSKRSKNRRRKHRTKASSRSSNTRDAGKFLSDVLNELRLFRDCETSQDVRAVLYEQTKQAVSAIADLVADADAFDVIELMRMREFPPVPDPRVVMPDGSALVVEIIAAVLLSRAGRKPGPRPRLETRPHEAVAELHRHGARLSRIALYRLQFESRLRDDPLAALAAEYQGAVLNIRNLQYDQIRLDHERRLFANATVEELMQRHLRYSYADVLAVRSAMTELSSQRMTALRDGTADIVEKYSDVPPGEIPAEDADAFMHMMIPFMFLPADRAVITGANVAGAAGIDVETATTVLNSYAQTFDSTVDAVDRVYNMLAGTNPFLLTPLVTDGEGNFVATTNDVGLDSLRRIFEKALPPNSPEFVRYDKGARQKTSESIALEQLEKILGVAPKFAGFEYIAPKTPETEHLLNRTCDDLNGVGKQVEGDGLFVFDDVAIILEVKGKSIAVQARRGDIRRLGTDLKATVGDACTQAGRLKRLILMNGGVWLGDRTWLDLTHVREVRSIVALLDDIGPLGTAIGDLQRAGIIAQNDDASWITSLHDLTTIAQICDRPSEFLLYIRRRTDSGVAAQFRAFDELDLYMLFLQGGLYVDPDSEVDETEPPCTLVADHCQPLNLWMQRDSLGECETPPVKPSFNAVPEILRLIDCVTGFGATGRLRFGADLLALAGETQKQITDTVAELARRATSDGNYHDAVLGFSGVWGYPTIFLAVANHDSDLDAARRRLQIYLTAKGYQVNSDRSYGLLFDETSRLDSFLYANTIPQDDLELNALVQRMGLGND
ncbi:hypothetical protein [Mycobacterium sp. URHB0044]|uniref:hypothetical protein n=1 Tax=Mycobacterium sp. URHB0044 TaxID=1380386 RepID=UPI0012DBED90|nr:hypothetical protein [Mycobacterium sp. URHB0044]